MVSFDATRTVTAAEVWSADPRWAQAPGVALEELRSIEEIIVFAAHADDETLGAGGLLASAAQAGIRVRVIVATKGAPERPAELRRALRALGVRDAPEFLGLPDGGLKNRVGELRAAIERRLDGSASRWVLAPWPSDRHGDHRTLGREVGEIAASRRLHAFFYPVWLWQWGTPDDLPWPRILQVPMTPSLRDRKRRALGQFVSQIAGGSNPDGVLTPGFLRNACCGPEVLVRPEPIGQAPPHRRALAAHFEELHSDREDPWSVRVRWYERRKREITLSALPREHFGRGLEIGCSIGELTARLAPRCDEFLAVDGSAAAVAAATQNLRALGNVSVRHEQVPESWPEGHFDLIVISEVAYYLAADQWRQVIRRCAESLSPDGIVLLCHWLGAAEDFAQSGTTAHQIFRDESGLAPVVEHRDAEFLLELFGKTDGGGG